MFVRHLYFTWPPRWRPLQTLWSLKVSARLDGWSSGKKLSLFDCSVLTDIERIRKDCQRAEEFVLRCGNCRPMYVQYSGYGVQEQDWRVKYGVKLCSVMFLLKWRPVHVTCAYLYILPAHVTCMSRIHITSKSCVYLYPVLSIDKCHTCGTLNIMLFAKLSE